MTCECSQCQLAEAMDRAVGEVIERFAECQVLVGGELTAALLPSPDGEWVRYADLDAARAAPEVTKAHLSGMLDTVDECARNLERAQAAEQRAAELDILLNNATRLASDEGDARRALEQRVAGLVAEVAKQSAEADRFALAVLAADRLLNVR